MHNKGQFNKALSCSISRLTIVWMTMQGWGKQLCIYQAKYNQKSFDSICMSWNIHPMQEILVMPESWLKLNSYSFSIYIATVTHAYIICDRLFENPPCLRANF